jgi:hypothetical protein
LISRQARTYANPNRPTSNQRAQSGVNILALTCSYIASITRTDSYTGMVRPVFWRP